MPPHRYLGTPGEVRRDRWKEPMANVIQYLYKRPKSHLTILGFFIVASVGILEYITGPEIYISVLYFIPIFFVTWFRERRIGITISIASAITWLLADSSSGRTYSHVVIPYWNMGVRLVTFLVITLVLSALKSSLEREKELARTDALTGIANRRYFIELANMEINRARRYKHPFTIVHIDLDNFKTINDRLGHSTGDTLLRLVANTIQSNIRATDIVARMGGDEFVILLPETAPEPAEVITHKVRKISLEVIQKNEWPVTLSIGAVTFITPPSTVDEMLNISDHVMYTAKNNGKDRIKYEVFSK